jgi:small subunit ribosomal protein S8|tara:strand:- start:8400 stop:8792 length:393 start_codon:yes stop_codon:yes gene_type:complete
MSMNDTTAAALSKIKNAEKTGKRFCIVKPKSKLLISILNIMKDKHYIGDYEEIKDGKGDLIKINLLGKINNIGAIKPRFSIKKDNFEKYEKRFLLAKDFGIIIVSTPKGNMTHIEAKEKKIGGRLISFVY